MSTHRVRTLELSAGWHWKQRDPSIVVEVASKFQFEPTESSTESDWTPASTFPSEIHVELLKAGRIPDPYVGANEHEVQCELQSSNGFANS
jgi:beta-mannosidase